MTQIIIQNLSGHSPLCLPIETHTTTQDVKQLVEQRTHIPTDQQILSTLNGRILLCNDTLQGDWIQLNLSVRLVGGKGGFGSMLRAQGGRMNAQKTTNFEACRDLQGRRIRTVNEAKKLQEELDALPAREAEKRENLKRKIEEALKEREPKKYLFDDNQFLEDTEEMVENVKSAVGNAIKKQKTVHKPVASTSVSLFDDDLSSDDEEDEEDEEDEDKKEEEAEVEEVEKEKENKPITKKDIKGKGKSA